MSLQQTYPDSIDITDEVEQYETGKVFQCECGQGFGVPYGGSMWSCPSCDATLVDEKGGEREPPEIDDEQQRLGDGPAEEVDTDSVDVANTEREDREDTQTSLDAWG